MALFVVTAARFNDAGDIEAFECTKADGQNNLMVGASFVLSVGELVKCIGQGDTFDLNFSTGSGRVSGGKVLVETLPDGGVTVTEERGDPGRTIRDLPRI